MSYVICYDRPGLTTMYLTSLPDEENPFSGIGFQGSENGDIPRIAGSCPTIEDAEKIIAYLNEDQDGYYEQDNYYYKEDTRK